MRTVKLTSKETGISIIVSYDTIVDPNIRNNCIIHEGTGFMVNGEELFEGDVVITEKKGMELLCQYQASAGRYGLFKGKTCYSDLINETYTIKK